MFGIFLLLAVLFSRIPIGMMRVRGHKKGLMAFRTHGNIENSPHIVGQICDDLDPLVPHLPLIHYAESICAVQIQPRKYASDHADDTRSELYICPAW